MQYIKYKSFVYREASSADVARQIVSLLWDWIYASGITKEEVIQVIKTLYNIGQKLYNIPKSLVNAVKRFIDKVGKNKAISLLKEGIYTLLSGSWSRKAEKLPDDLLTDILKFIAKTKLELGEFLILLDAAVERDITPLLNSAELQVSIPKNLLNNIVELLSSQALDFIEFIKAIDDALDSPPPGFKWEVNENGRRVLARTSKKTVKEFPIIKGKRFYDKVFIGVWWEADEDSQLNDSILQWVYDNNGDVFYIKKKSDGNETNRIEYHAFAILPITQDFNTYRLCFLASKLRDENGDIRLSAISMKSIGEHKAVSLRDKLNFGCINSAKYNWKYTVVDVLNGRVIEYKNSDVYNNLISAIRAK